MALQTVNLASMGRSNWPSYEKIYNRRFLDRQGHYVMVGYRNPKTDADVKEYLDYLYIPSKWEYILAKANNIDELNQEELKKLEVIIREKIVRKKIKDYFNGTLENEEDAYNSYDIYEYMIKHPILDIYLSKTSEEEKRFITAILSECGIYDNKCNLVDEQSYCINLKVCDFFAEYFKDRDDKTSKILLSIIKKYRYHNSEVQMCYFPNPDFYKPTRGMVKRRFK